MGFLAYTVVQNLPFTARDARSNMGLIPGSRGSPVVGNGNPLQYSCLGNSMDRGALWAIVHGVFLPYSSIVSKPPLVFYTSQCILESSGQVLREKKPVGIFDWDYIESIDCFGENQHLYNIGSSNAENHTAKEN